MDTLKCGTTSIANFFIWDTLLPLTYIVKVLTKNISLHNRQPLNKTQGIPHYFMVAWDFP